MWICSWYATHFVCWSWNLDQSHGRSAPTSTLAATIGKSICHHIFLYLNAVFYIARVHVTPTNCSPAFDLATSGWFFDSSTEHHEHQTSRKYAYHNIQPQPPRTPFWPVSDSTPWFTAPLDSYVAGVSSSSPGVMLHGWRLVAVAFGRQHRCRSGALWQGWFSHRDFWALWFWRSQH